MDIVQEMGKSYLVVKDNTPENLTYMRQMLTYNRITGFVACQKGLYDNNAVLKYDITNMRSLENTYERGQMSYEQLKELLFSINSIMIRGRAFLFLDEGYVLSPEYIFCDIKEESIHLIYVPLNEENKSGDGTYGRYYKLADFFLEKINHKDEGAVGIAYQFYRLSKEPLFSLDAFMTIIEKEKPQIITERNAERDNTDKYNSQPVYFEFEDTVVEDEDNVEKCVTLNFKIPIILFVMIIIIGGMFLGIPTAKQYIRQFVVVEICLSIVMITLVARNVIRAIKDKNSRVIMPQEKVSLDEFWSGDGETQFFDSGSSDADEETQYFDIQEEERHTISWVEADKIKVRDIASGDNIIGKKYDEVDVCISEPSISRKHAKITIDKKGIWLQDLDSTNGTFLNGNRLLPGEKTKIDESCEIRFGKVEVSVV